MENPIFIVGLPRTGSTLWHNIISMNPEIFRLTEMLFLTPVRKDFRYFIRKQVGNLSNDENVEKMIELIFSHEAIPGITGAFWQFKNIEVVKDSKLKNEIYYKIKESDKSLDSIFKILIEEITCFSGFSRCCIKFPVYVNYVPKLLEWYPKCKIIHIIRDPRAMAMSRKNDPGTAIKIKKYPSLGFIIKKIMVLFVILQYIWTSKLHCKYKEFENYTLFRYEDLLVDPESVIKELCEFTEIDFFLEMIKPQKGRHEHQPSSLTGKQQRSFDVKTASRWTTAISPLEKWIITVMTKRSMKRFGYDPDNHPVYINS